MSCKNYVRFGTVRVLLPHVKPCSSIICSCKRTDWPTRKDVLLLTGDRIGEGGWKRRLCRFNFCKKECSWDEVAEMDRSEAPKGKVEF